MYGIRLLALEGGDSYACYTIAANRHIEKYLYIENNVAYRMYGVQEVSHVYDAFFETG